MNEILMPIKLVPSGSHQSATGYINRLDVEVNLRHKNGPVPEG